MASTALSEYRTQNELISADSSREAKIDKSHAAYRGVGRPHADDTNLATLVLEYTKKELTSYTRFRVAGISEASVPWMKRVPRRFGIIPKGLLARKRATRYDSTYPRDTPTSMHRGRC